MKKVIIEKAPKKKVVIEALPEAAFGMNPFAFKRNAEAIQKMQNDFDKQKRNPSFRFTGIDLSPISGNPYFQKGMNYLSQGINQIPGIMEYNKTGKISNDNILPFYSNSMYSPFISEPEVKYSNVTPYYTKKGNLRFKAEGGYLPIAQTGNLVGDDFDFSQQGLAQTNPYVASTPFEQPNNIFREERMSDREKQIRNATGIYNYQPEEMSLNRPNLQGDLNQELSRNTKLDVPKLPGQKEREAKRGFRKYTENLAMGAPAFNMISGITNFGKGFVDTFGDIQGSTQEKARRATIGSQAAYSEAENTTPSEIYGYSWEGRNALNSTAYGGYAADGMQIRQIGGMGEPNVEVEGREHIKLPNGFSQEIQGKSHAQGGIPLNLPQGTQIFSEKLKIEISFLKQLAEINPEYQFLKNISLPKSGKISYADLAKKFETKKYVDLLNSKSADSIQMTTAQMMIAQNVAKLEKIFMLQEQNKISGVHGPQVQQKAMEENQEVMAQEQAEQQQEPEEPMMAHGGYHLPSYQNAGKTGIDYSNWTGETFKTTEGIITPTNVNLNIDPKATWSQYAKKYGPLDKRITKKQTREAIAALQENIYDDYLDTEHGREALNKMWQEFGVTNQMEEKYGDIAKKIKNKEKLSLDDLNRLRGNYIDGFAGKRLPEYLEPRIYTPNIKGPTSSAPEEETSPTSEKVTKYTSPIIGLNMAMGIPLPQVYGSNPLNFYNLNPSFIDPRYLNIDPQLNEITRGERAIQSNIGSRGSANIANLLQAKGNAIAAKQQAFGQKYNYDRAQDAAAQQFNAQAKMDTDRYNQQAWYGQFENPKRIEESLKDTQIRTDLQQGVENMRRMQAYNQNKNYIDNTFFPFKNLTGEQISGFLGTPQGKQYLEEKLVASSKKKKKKETKDFEKEALQEMLASYGIQQNTKYGGKIRIKPKIKGRFNK